MIKVVIDTNIFVSALSSRSLSHWLIKSLMNEKFEVYFTNEILLEYEEVLIQKYGSEIGSNFINAIQKLPNANNIVTYYNFNLIQADPDDNKFVDCAIAANVDWLITNDRHFNVLKDINFPVVNIIRLEDFEQQFAEFLK